MNKRGVLEVMLGPQGSEAAPVEMQHPEELESKLANPAGAWVVVEFGAGWAAAVAAMESAFDKLAREFPQVCFVRVDLDRLAALGPRFGITRVPSYAFFKAGHRELSFAGCSERKLREQLLHCLELGPASRGVATSEAALPGTDGQLSRLTREAPPPPGRAGGPSSGRGTPQRSASPSPARAARGPQQQQAEAVAPSRPKGAAGYRFGSREQERRKEAEEERRKRLELELELERTQALAAEAERHAAQHMRQEAQKALEELSLKHAQEQEAREAAVWEAQRQAEQAALLRRQLEAERQTQQAAQVARERGRLEHERVARREQEQAAQSRREQQAIELRSTVEARGHARLDEADGRILMETLKFKERFFGISRQDPPVGELGNPVAARAVLEDTHQLWTLTQAPAEVVLVRKLGAAAAKSNEKKDQWEQELAGSRAEALRSALVELGIPQQMLTARTVTGSTEGNYVSLRPQRGAAA